MRRAVVQPATILYYGDSGASSPPADKSNVYEFWDDFNSFSSSNWGSPIVSSGGSVSVSNGKIITQSSEETDYGYVNKQTPLASGFEVEAYGKGTAGTGTGAAGLSIMDYQIPETDVGDAEILDGHTLTHFLRRADVSYWDSKGGFVSTGAALAEDTYYTLKTRVFNNTLQLFVDGNQNPAGDITLTDWGTSFYLKIGDSYATNENGSSTINWIKVRRYVSTEPSVTVGNEVANYYSSSGTLVSSVYDAETSVDWNEINWGYSTPSDTSIILATRSGDTFIPDGTWSSWSSEYTSSGSLITSPGARYIQYGATLSTTDISVTPTLRDVTINYTYQQSVYSDTIELEEDNTPPVGVTYDNLPGDNRPVNLDDGEVITTNPYIIKVKPESNTSISKVEFYVDDNLICTETQADANGVYSCSWDTSKYHSTIKIIAYDIDGNTATIIREVTVDPSAYAASLPETGKNN